MAEYPELAKLRGLRDNLDTVLLLGRRIYDTMRQKMGAIDRRRLRPEAVSERETQLRQEANEQLTALLADKQAWPSVEQLTAASDTWAAATYLDQQVLAARNGGHVPGTTPQDDVLRTVAKE